jgi:hypothetical protein
MTYEDYVEEMKTDRDWSIKYHTEEIEKEKGQC